MSKITIELRVRGESRQRVWLRQGQIIEVGSSDSVDISIPDDPFLEPVHIALAHQPMGCFCECLADNSEMRVNEAVFQRKRLKNHDVVLVGNSELEVTIEPDSSSMPMRRSGGPKGTVVRSGGQSPIVDAAPAEWRETGTPAAPAAGVTDGDVSAAPLFQHSPEPTSTPIDFGDAGYSQSAQLPRPVAALKTSATPPPAQPTPPPAGTAADGDLKLSYRAEKLAAEVWRYGSDLRSNLDLETVVGRLAELFKIFLLLPPSMATRLLSQGKFISRLMEININQTLIESPSVDSAIELLKNSTHRQEILLIASHASIDDLAASLQANAFTFGRPSIFSMQISMATQSLADEIMLGKIAVLMVDDRGWEFYSTVDPATEHRYLGFDRPPIDWEQG